MDKEAETMRKPHRLLPILWLLQFVNYIDRTNIAVAGPIMMKGLHFDPSSFGLVLSAFTLGYAFMQIPGGALADKFGAKVMLVVAPIVWSLFTGATGLVTSLTALIVVRVSFGLGEGASNAAVYKIIGDNFLPKNRVVANSIWNSAFALGPAFAAPFAVWLIGHVGWQKMFLWCSLPGVIVAGLAFLYIPKQERTQDFQRLAASEPPLNWSAVISRPSSWLILIAYAAFNIAFWGYLGWMPSYLTLSRNIDLKALGTAASVPYMFGTAGLIVFGWLGSRVFFRYLTIQVAITYLLAAAFLYVTYSGSTVRRSLIGLSAAAFFLYGGFGPFVTIVLDLAPLEMRAAFSGFVSTGGQLGGFVAPIVVGYIVKSTGSFQLGFVLMIIALCCSASCYVALTPQVLKIRSERTAPARGPGAVPVQAGNRG
jgi:MFS transporter, ACS family, D-galactonate transporter